MSQAELERRVEQNANDTAAIYDIRKTHTERFDQVDRRFDGIDVRLDGIDKRFDGIDGRLDSLDGKLDGLAGKIDSVIEVLTGR